MKIKFSMIFCVLLIFCTFGTLFAQAANPNLVKNGDFSRAAREWPNWPNDWNITWKGGDGYEPVKTEKEKFCGYAENTFSFTLVQNITGLAAGSYTLSADFRLNPDSVAEDIVMNVYSGATLLKSRSVRAELFAAAKETDVRFDLTGIQVKSPAARIEFAGTNIKKTIFIDNVVFSKDR
ncbi:MAG: hypothetical protein FWH38_00845 [Treponema sp.]|nr:hypothetical protein [Treponema sp.]